MRLFGQPEGNKTFWMLLPLAIVVGLAFGFAGPLVASYQAKVVFVSIPGPRPAMSVTKRASLAPEPSAYDLVRDLELEKLSARNKRLEALVATLRQKQAKSADHPILDERGPQY